MDHHDIHADALDALTDDGKTFLLGAPGTLRLRIQPDDLDPFTEYDCYGAVIHAEDRALYDRHEGRYRRPSHFSGNAEKIQGGRSDTYWWEPPADGPKRGTPDFVKLRDHVQDLLVRGMYVVTVELVKGADAYGQGIVTQVASLGGVDTIDDAGYLRDIVDDLLLQLDI